ncbi:type 4a pilus biogenesis protein PilO [Campylobacter sp. RM16192]|uniref:type 4a pilus biogenesis protein PilO n=1 Tax=Campylobacter sp. RM16192 TaxID=1660080 RepID=UPI0014513652|nr:type 4a pilus biogenesis protein PilO [Campylobacter sp. RM16192]QCD52698.1 hypothetical protein CDOMC_1080 [Campylobacter sp. RM16192]
MKKNSTLAKIDNYFDGKKDTEVSIIFLMSLAITIFLTYFLTWNQAQQYYESVLNQNDEISRKLNDTNNYLASVTVNGDINFKIKEQQKLLNSLNKELNIAQFKNKYFDNKLYELSYLLFNEQNWARFLDNLAFLANKNNIKITKISNEFKNPTPKKIEQVLNIKIDIEGNFKDIIGYINSIEESDLVVDVNNIHISSSTKNLIGTIGIYVWGMKY